MARIKTSLTIDEELHRRLKMLAVELKIPYSKLLDEAIALYLNHILSESH